MLPMGKNGALAASQTFEVLVTPVNDGPSITSAAPNTGVEDQLYSYQFQVVDPDDLNDGLGLSWSLLNAPVGMTISNTGLVSWIPTEGQLTLVRLLLS